MGKGKIRKFVLSPDVYPMIYGFWLGKYDHSAMKRYVIRHHIQTENWDPPKPESTHSGCCIFLDYGAMVWLPKIPVRASDYGALIHEITHAVLYTGRKLGFERDSGSDEFFCYMIDYLTRGALAELWKK